MHIRAIQVMRQEQNQFVIDVNQGQSMIESFANTILTEQEAISLRFSGARFGTEAFLVIGVREQGRGFDVLIAETMWQALVDPVETVKLQVLDTNNNCIVSITFDWDEEAFQEFLDKCQIRFEDDPDLEVMGKIVHFFS